ncbi:hypothetical protein AGMMS50230_12020 [Spirochaetia bacterium]|nr:hypothetical protein AGMMS50230_12020 [Spirochaetia bacterium]
MYNGGTVKKAGDLLASILDERSLKKAKEYGVLFSSAVWSSLLESCSLSQGFSHSRIVELERTVLLIEADHPGWVQLLQMKQNRLLEVIQRRFPELALTGISFRLSREPLEHTLPESEKPVVLPRPAEKQEVPKADNPESSDTSVHDDKLRAVLQKLGESIQARNGNQT